MTKAQIMKRVPTIYRSCAHPQAVWFEVHWRPIIEALAESNEKLVAAIGKIDLNLRIPAAEYVPAIGKAFHMIDKALADHAGRMKKLYPAIESKKEEK